jgi:hypothetical protein
MTAYKANLFIPGAGKSGTSSLHGYLNQHPAINMSVNKEPQYFAVDTEFKKGPDYHNSLFNQYGKENALYFGESSTTYFLSVMAIKRIHENINNPKFIFVLRNPIDRIYSHFYWIRNMMHENVLPFEEEIMEDMKQSFDANKPSPSGAYKHYVLESSYGSAIDAYIENFGKRSIYIITSERLKSDPLEVLNGCFDFLGLPRLDKIETEFQNITPPARVYTTPGILRKFSFLFPDSIYRKLKNRILEVFFTKYEPVPALSVTQREWLKRLLIPEIEKLIRVTGRSFSEWPEFSFKPA